MAVQQGYRGLKVWEKSFQLSIEVYKLTQDFPPREQFGITNQIQRCAVSVPSNLAEGYGRQLPGSFLNFVRISSGSLNELETQLLIASELKYVEDTKLSKIRLNIAEIRKMLHGLIRKLNSKNKSCSGS